MSNVLRKFTALLFLALLLDGCRYREPGPPISPPFILADFETARAAIPFSDKEEIRGSKTVFALSSIEGTSGTGLRVKYDVESYAGFALPLPTPLDLEPYDTLAFQARRIEGDTPSLQLQWTTLDGERYKMSLAPFLKNLSGDWQRIEVPLDTLIHSAPGTFQQTRELSVIFRPGKGVMDFDEFELMNTGKKAEAVMIPKKSKALLPAGLGAWCYGEPALTLELVKQYNAGAPAACRIRYLFPWAGSISFDRSGKAGFTWNPEHALAIARGLENEAMVFPMIDGLSGGAELAGTETWDELASKIAQALEREPLFYGVHFDLEPQEDFINPLYAAMKKYSGKPVTAAVGQWNLDTFRFTDLLVLMGYDWATDPTAFSQAATKKIPRFLCDARTAGGKAMIGIPAIATHREFEEISEQPDGPRQSTGYRMIDFLHGSFAAIDGVAQHDSLIGISLWAIHPDTGLHGGSDVQWYYPTRISDDIWTLLQTRCK